MLPGTEAEMVGHLTPHDAGGKFHADIERHRDGSEHITRVRLCDAACPDLREGVHRRVSGHLLTVPLRLTA